MGNKSFARRMCVDSVEVCAASFDTLFVPIIKLQSVFAHSWSLKSSSLEKESVLLETFNTYIGRLKGGLHYPGDAHATYFSELHMESECRASRRITALPSK